MSENIIDFATKKEQKEKADKAAKENSVVPAEVAEFGQFLGSVEVTPEEAEEFDEIYANAAKERRTDGLLDIASNDP